MCGVGHFLHRSLTAAELEALAEIDRHTLHRMPDDKTHFVQGNVGLATRCLSIPKN